MSYGTSVILVHYTAQCVKNEYMKKFNRIMFICNDLNTSVRRNCRKLNTADFFHTPYKTFLSLKIASNFYNQSKIILSKTQLCMSGVVLKA